MTSDPTTQLAILADALTKIVDLASENRKLVAPPLELLGRAGDIAVEALAVAATYGPLPPRAPAGDEQSVDPDQGK